MSQDVPLPRPLARPPAVPVADLLALLERMARPDQDPLLARLVAVDEEGERGMPPLVAAVLEHLQRNPALTCYQALLEALTGTWNAAVRAAVVARLRAAGLPPDDLLLRLQAPAPTLGVSPGSPRG